MWNSGNQEQTQIRGGSSLMNLELRNAGTTRTLALISARTVFAVFLSSRFKLRLHHPGSTQGIQILLSASAWSVFSRVPEFQIQKAVFIPPFSKGLGPLVTNPTRLPVGHAKWR